MRIIRGTSTLVALGVGVVVEDGETFSEDVEFRGTLEVAFVSPEESVSSGTRSITDAC